MYAGVRSKRDPYMKYIRFPFLILHFLIASILGLLVGLLRPFNPDNSRICARLYSVVGLFVMGMKTKVIGREHMEQHQPCLYIANHQSNWDLLVLGSVVPKRTVSLGKKSLKWVPLFGQLYWLAGNVLIDRGNRQKAMEALDITEKALTEKNTAIWIFPEGTRNKGHNVKTFKKGAFVTAINAGVPIVPVCCSPYLKELNLNACKSGTAYIKALPPISTKGLTLDDAENLMKQCQELVQQEVESLEQLCESEKTGKLITQS
ncbi:1-acyl-sn-glycerol-3-phosphate acyltransferase [Oceanobacter sp. RED65]|uniref:1-acyl-sn-glycerol-3-phosphate acyltransferase n=2 Tax=Bermanella marisrubri TaxID=207949 RepID=Q1N0K0_9GAMM|nr:1-acyl-sn-glycerol-3-phosphate acyltransferase [Oceanobacter sp. RED65] [Bermanella marisrubri]